MDTVFDNIPRIDAQGLTNLPGDLLLSTNDAANTGIFTFSVVAALPPLTGQNISGVTLAPGAHADYNTSYTLTQADLNGTGNAGSHHNIDNTATADSKETKSVKDSVELPLVYAPSIAIDQGIMTVTGSQG